MKAVLPVGKLPHELLDRILRAAPTTDDRVLLGPGIGLDCAVIDFGLKNLVLKTEPITFASDNIGWYAVQIAANDIATMGAVPSWGVFTVLLPEGITTDETVIEIAGQLSDTCRALNIIMVGGHTEITHDLHRPIIVTTLAAEIDREKLIIPENARSGDALLLTKGIPIEATALLAREFPQFLQDHLTAEELHEARNFLFDPGISVIRDSQIAVQSGGVHAMHDPTEGGIATALWEMAEACQKQIIIDPNRIIIPPLAGKICSIFGLNPLGTLASGALLMAVASDRKNDILTALNINGIKAAEIGLLEDGPVQVVAAERKIGKIFPRFDQDEIGRVYEKFHYD